MRKILVADDDPLNRKVLGEMLKIIDPTLAVSYAEDGAEALRLISEQSFDLVLTDISMPGRDGLSLLKAVRSELQHSVPMVCITAFAVSGEREKLLAEGFDDYLPKPVDMNTLRTIVTRYSSASPT